MKRLFAIFVTLLLLLPAVGNAADRYIGLGDSVAAPSNSYVALFGNSLSSQGITDVQNVAMGGETSGSILGTQLQRALDLIHDDTDTRVVSVGIGGNDWLGGTCQGPWNGTQCPFADNLASLLGQLQGALADDPGEERMLVMGYYNPYSGQGTALETDTDRGLRGSDMVIDPSAFSDRWGMTDIVAWEASCFGGTLVDAWQPFRDGGGQALMSDPVHPNAAGQQILADLFAAAMSSSPAACPATTPFATWFLSPTDQVLHGFVEPRMTAVRWWFEYGATTALGQRTAVQELGSSAGMREVTVGLPPGACHVRLVVENDRGQFATDQVATAPDATCAPPDTQPPAVVLSGSLRQRLTWAVRVVVRCPAEACTAIATGRLRIAGRRKPLALVTTQGYTPAASHKLDLRVPKAVGTTVKAALRRHRRVTAVITVRAKDAAGNVTTASRTVRIR